MYGSVADLSAGALPIGVKFCMVVRPDLGQVFSYFREITAPEMVEFWGQRAIWRDMLLIAKAPVILCAFICFHCYLNFSAAKSGEMKLIYCHIRTY